MLIGTLLVKMIPLHSWILLDVVKPTIINTEKSSNVALRENAFIKTCIDQYWQMCCNSGQQQLKYWIEGEGLWMGGFSRRWLPLIYSNLFSLSSSSHHLVSSDDYLSSFITSSASPHRLIISSDDYLSSPLTSHPPSRHIGCPEADDQEVLWLVTRGPLVEAAWWGLTTAF